MTRTIIPAVLVLPVLLGPAVRLSSAQVSLADDIIIAAQGKENAEQNRKTSLGRALGARASPFTRRPGSSDIVLGQDPNRRVPRLLRLTPPTNPAEIRTPGPGETAPGDDPGAAFERLRMPPALPSTEFSDPFDATRDTTEIDEGPPDGLTLDAAIERLIRCNRELRFKGMEIPQAEADVLTAGLRENPLLFYSSDSVPYGSYSPQRPGDISHGLSIVLPFDYSGKRRARMTLAEREKCILEAQYRDAVRLAIGELDTAFVDALARRKAARSAERGLELLDQLLAQARTNGAAEDAIDDLLIERELAAIAAGDERARYINAKHRVAVLLDLSPQESDSLELRGSLSDIGPNAPPVQTLVTIALEHRPDLAAYRLGISRAQAELGQERAERYSDAYFLYTPFQYRDNSQVDLLSSTSWGAGLFVSVPLFNRNQGNLSRARINIAQSQAEASAVERLVIAEVRQAVRNFEDTYEDAQRLTQTVLPAVQRKRDRLWRQYRSGAIDSDAFLSVQRDNAALVRYHRDTCARHRQNALKLNTAVGYRVLP